MVEKQPKSQPPSDEPAAQRSAAQNIEDVVHLIDQVRLTAPECMDGLFHGGVPRSSTAGVYDTRPGPATALTPPARIGLYEVQEMLGRGGSGTVWRAYDPKLKRTIALKIPHAEVIFSEALRERFMLEAKAAAALDHPNIIPVFEVGTEGPLCYIASAYCRGPTLDDYLEQNRVGVRMAAALVRELADAVEHAHHRGVLHRDIKAANILLEKTSDQTPWAEDFGWLPRLTDFGLARMDGSEIEQTKTGAILGSPAYMAPEQARGERDQVGRPADVHALGILLYQMLTTEKPFHRGSVVGTLEAVRNQMPKPPRAVNFAVSADLQAVCMKCLEKQPEQRYPTAAALRDDLQRFLDGCPVVARNIGPLGRLTRWARREPQTAALISAIVLIALAAALGGTWAAAHFRYLAREREIALAQQTEAEVRANETLLQSLLRRADRAHGSGEEGQRTETLEIVDQAWQLAREIGQAEEARLPLRDAVAAALIRDEITTLWQQPSIGQAVGFNADLTLCAWADREKNIEVVRTRDGKRVANLPLGESEYRRFNLFAGESNLIYVYDVFGTWSNFEAFMWDPVSGSKRSAGQFYGAVDDSFATVQSFNADASRVAFVPSHDGETERTIVVADSFSGEEICRFALPMEMSVQFHGADELIAFAGSARFHSAESGKQLREIGDVTVQGYYGGASRSPSRVAIAPAPSSQVLRLFDGESGDPLIQLPWQEEVQRCDFIDDRAKLLAVSQKDAITRIIDVQTGTPLLRFEGKVQRVQRGRAPRLGLAGRDVDRVVEWQPGALVRTWHSHHQAFVSGVDFSSDSKFVVSVGLSNYVRVRDIETGVVVAEAYMDGLTSSAIFADDDRHLLIASWDGLYRWDWQARAGFKKGADPLEASDASGDGKYVRKEQMEALCALEEDKLDRAAWCQKRNRLVAIYHGQRFTCEPAVFDLDKDANLPKLFAEVDGLRHSAAISDDGNWAAFFDSQIAYLYNLNQGEERWEISTDGPSSVTFMPGEKEVLVVAADKATFYSLASKEVVRQFDLPVPISADRAQDRMTYGSAVAVSPDGKLLAYPVTPRQLALIDLELAELRVNLTQARSRNVVTLKFSPDASLLGSLSRNGMLDVWNLDKLNAEFEARGLCKQNRGAMQAESMVPGLPTSIRECGVAFCNRLLNWRSKLSAIIRGGQQC